MMMRIAMLRIPMVGTPRCGVREEGIAQTYDPDGAAHRPYQQ
jgi:hypothetical protein